MSARSAFILAALFSVAMCLGAATDAAPAKQSAKRRTASSKPVSLTSAQRRSGFTSAAYAAAYDQFGRDILRRDHDVQEVAASSRDSPQGFYVLLKKRRVPPGAAKSRVAGYYAAFVRVRGRFFPGDEAARCDITLRSADDQIMAFGNQDGAQADTLFYR